MRRKNRGWKSERIIPRQRRTAQNKSRYLIFLLEIQCRSEKRESKIQKASI
jgi:hypothetical protein